MTDLHITEIISKLDTAPDWAQKAFKEGIFFCVALDKIHKLTQLEEQVAACSALLDRLLVMQPGDGVYIIHELETALGRVPTGKTIQ